MILCLCFNAVPVGKHCSRTFTPSPKRKNTSPYTSNQHGICIVWMPCKLIFLPDCGPFPCQTFPSVVFRKHQKADRFTSLRFCPSKEGSATYKEYTALSRHDAPSPGPVSYEGIRGMCFMFTKCLPEVPRGNGGLISRENVLRHWEWIAHVDDLQRLCKWLYVQKKENI